MCPYHVSSFKAFRNHYVRTHRNDPNFSVSCCIGHCGFTTRKWTTFRAHMSRKHPGVDMESAVTWWVMLLTMVIISQMWQRKFSLLNNSTKNTSMQCIPCHSKLNTICPSWSRCRCCLYFHTFGCAHWYYERTVQEEI